MSVQRLVNNQFVLFWCIFYVTTVIGVVELLVVILALITTILLFWFISESVSMTQPSSEVGIITRMANGMSIAKIHLKATF